MGRTGKHTRTFADYASQCATLAGTGTRLSLLSTEQRARKEKGGRRKSKKREKMTRKTSPDAREEGTKKIWALTLTWLVRAECVKNSKKNLRNRQTER